MSDRDDLSLRPRRESSLWIYVILILVLLVAAFLWWRWPNIPGLGAPQDAQQQQQSSNLPTAPADAPPSTAQPGGSPSDAPQLPGTQQAGTPPLHPALTPPDPNLPALGESDPKVDAALNSLVGQHKSALGLLATDGFVRRFVATVDNLPREYAPTRVWPVHRTPPQFTVVGEGEAQALATENAARYAPLLRLVETVDPATAATMYFKLYPLFQEAYEELGYSGRYFNDRLVAVIDHLLAAPEPAGPVRLTRVEVKSDVPMARPWAHYEFVDPRLESMSAGQKIMVRVGLDNERRLKTRLRAFRAHIVATPPQSAKK